MRKGDERRQELLNAAERLFCTKGYEATSVQDILDVLHLSKGGFYHHFASKDEVLRGLCDRRAQRAAEDTAQAFSEADAPLARINAVLHGFIPLRREEMAFAAMLQPVIAKPEGKAMAMIYQDALCSHFLPLLKAEVASAAAVEAIYPPVRDMENIILQVVNQCWIEILSCGFRVDPAAVQQTLGKYRRAVELLLDAPYGSIEIVRVEEWAEMVRMLG